MAKRPPRRPSTAAYVRVPGLTPRLVGEVKWWKELVRQTRLLLARDPRAAGAALARARAGFYPESTLYSLDDPEFGDYVSNRQKELTWGLNWPAAQLLDDKLAFFYMARHFGLPTPEVLGVVVRGRTAALSGGYGDHVQRWLEEHGRLVVRPTRGAAGLGLLFLELVAGEPRVNGEPLGWDVLEAQLRTLDDHIVTEFVQQGSYARSIFAESTNTIRLLSMRQGDAPPFLAVAVHRFGVPSSAPADNWSRGALSALVDLETGRLGPGASLPTTGGPEAHAVHPTSGASLEGVLVPHWAEIRDRILAAARQMAFLPYVGWDVVVTEDGFQVIEGNKYSNVNLIQVHAPLMRDERVRAFFEDLRAHVAIPGRRRTVTAKPRPAAVVKIPGLPPRAIGHARWGLRLIREAAALARARLPVTEIAPALRLTREGFTPSSISLYGLNGDGRGEYLSDQELELSWIIDWPAAGLLDDKLAFSFMLEHLGVPAPRVRGVVVRGRVHSLDDGPDGPGWLRGVIQEGRGLVVRATRGGASHGTWFVAPADEGCRINGELVGWRALEQRIRALGDHLITEFVQPAAYGATLSPDTRNALQLITANPSDGPPFIVAAVHRFGDLTAGVDVHTGLIGPTRGTRASHGGGERLERHPNTHERVAEVRVPHWAEVRDGILACAAKLPFLPHVGWNVVVTDDGFAVVGGDKVPDVTTAQIHQPLLADPRAKAFYAEHGVLSVRRAAFKPAEQREGSPADGAPEAPLEEWPSALSPPGR